MLIQARTEAIWLLEVDYDGSRMTHLGSYASTAWPPLSSYFLIRVYMDDDQIYWGNENAVEFIATTSMKHKASPLYERFE